MRTRLAATIVTAALALIATITGSTSPAGAAGIVTHAWMALDAVPLVEDPDLRDLLEANLAQVEAGAHFPDGGYWNRSLGIPGGDYGEESHWQRFFDAYEAEIRNDPLCADLRDPTGPCAPRVAFLLGARAHGLGDEVWDWLFEPYGADHREDFVPPELIGDPALADVWGMELQMDIVAIAHHGRPTPTTPAWPDVAGLEAAFHAVGRTDLTQAGIAEGKTGLAFELAAEVHFASLYAEQVLTEMPWTSAHMVSAPGGVTFGARAIAGAYDNTWDRLLGGDPRTEVAITYPGDGQTDIPSTGWERDSFEPGPHFDRGGASTRITAVLTYALPYVTLATSPGGLPTLLPEGAMTLELAGSGQAVPAKAGYPKAVPWGRDAGTHTIDFQPAEDLAPCTEYRVRVTEALLDAEDEPVAPASWTFRTAGCPEPPTTTTTSLDPIPTTNPTAVAAAVTTPAVAPTAVPAVATSARPNFTG